MGPSVSRGFLKDLKNLDKRLDVKWNGANHIITFLRANGEAVNVYRVKTENGGYREPDQRDIMAVAGGDLAREDMKSRLLKLSYASEKMREKARADARDNIRYMTKDSKTQLANAAIQLTNQGKGNSAHRRIDPDAHRKGRTWAEIKGENARA